MATGMKMGWRIFNKEYNIKLLRFYDRCSNDDMNMAAILNKWKIQIALRDVYSWWVYHTAVCKLSVMSVLCVIQWPIENLSFL